MTSREEEIERIAELIYINVYGALADNVPLPSNVYSFAIKMAEAMLIERDALRENQYQKIH